MSTQLSTSATRRQHTLAFTDESGERKLNSNDAAARRQPPSTLLKTSRPSHTQRPRRPPTPMQSKPAFRKPGDAATLPELIKFLIDRTGYIRALEEEGTPEAFSRIENLKELANAAQDAQERGETLAEFLDHAALVSDTDQYNADSRVTLMTLHAAKGLEFPLVILRRPGRRTLPALAHAQRSRPDGRGAPPLLRRHDARHGYADPDPRALSPPLRQ